jgi:cell division transport system permease protein
MSKRRTRVKHSEGFRRVLKVWLGQHLLAFQSSLGQIQRNLAGNLFSIAVIGISLALPAGFYLMLDNAQRVMQSWDGTIQIALYLHHNVDDARAETLRQQLSTHELVEGVTLISRDQALLEYKQLSGFGEALDSLEENPLPAMLLIQPRITTVMSEPGEALLEELGKLPEVESAQFDRQWVRRLVSIVHILKRTVIILSTVLSVAVLLIIGNTIRLSIINKRTEIAINKLFGATNAYIQRPFLYSGLIYGFAGSCLAWLLLLVTTLIMKQPVNQLAILYNSDFQLQSLDITQLLILLLTGSGLGLAGSWVAVGRHIRDTEPM